MTQYPLKLVELIVIVNILSRYLRVSFGGLLWRWHSCWRSVCWEYGRWRHVCRRYLCWRFCYYVVYISMLLATIKICESTFAAEEFALEETDEEDCGK